MKRDNIKTTAELSRVLDVPYTTMDNILKRDTFDNVKFSILKKLCMQFHVDMLYLCDDEIESSMSIESNTNDPNLKKLLSNYTDMNLTGQYALADYSSYLAGKQEYSKHC